MEEIKDGMPDEQQVLELGIMLGQRRAFGMVAGRCSAAQAECLRKVRDEKTYLKFATNWAGFCERHLKISKRTADRAIALLKKHGTLYFETAALTGSAPCSCAPAFIRPPKPPIPWSASGSSARSRRYSRWSTGWSWRSGRACDPVPSDGPAACGP